jgi:UTP:GlnB (protein PII) uridylyltransferase
MSGAESTTEFVKSMPATYTQVFTPAEIEEHARFAGERGSRIALAGLWRSLPSGLAIFCVIASDRPGVVALISAAFVAHQLDVCSAQIYSRKRPDGTTEAVDFFWVHGSAASAASVAKRHRACAHTIQEFLTGSSEPELARSGAEVGSERRTDAQVTLAQREPESRLWVLTIEVSDRTGLLHAIARTLYRQGVEIVESDVRTSAGIARDRFVIASAGSARLDPPAAERLKSALRAAIRDLFVPAPRAVG